MPVQTERHPPERGRRPTFLIGCGCSSCCCCCCCCLHTLGGLVGAGVASVSRTPEESLTVRVYWILLAILSVASLAIGTWAFENHFLISGVVFLICFPVLQLAASVLSLLVLPFFGPHSPAKIGEITWKSLLFAAIGFGIMVGGVLLLARGLQTS